MYTIYRFKLVVLCLVFSLLVSGCTKDQEKIDLENNYLFTGRVIDQITSEPVSGAIVRYGHLFLSEFDHDLVKMPQYTFTGADGKYKLLVPKIIFDDRSRNPGPVIYSEDSDYIGSNVLNVSNGGEDMELKLYSTAQLNIHVKNDTISNNIDETILWIRGQSGFWPYPGFVGRVVMGMYPYPNFTCKGRDFDTVFVIKPLWGNLNYSVGGGKSYFMGPYYFSTSVTLIPGTINYLDVSF